MRSAELALAITVGYLASAQASFVSLRQPLLVPIAAMSMTSLADALSVPGVDISKAGQTMASRLTYLSGLIQETQWNVFARCSQILHAPEGDAPAEAVAFCRDTMPVPSGTSSPTR